MSEHGKKVARILLDLDCVRLSPDKPFTYSSGLKGPIYCDNRKLISHPEEWKDVLMAMLAVIEESKARFDHYAGLATAGIPHAAALAQMTNQSMVYVRSKPKGHGRGRVTEGDPRPGDRLLFIEDLVNQASSLKACAEGTRNDGLEPIGCLCIVDYQLDTAKEVYGELDIPLFSVTTYTDLLETAQTGGRFSPTEVESLDEWRKDPVGWSEKH